MRGSYCTLDAMEELESVDACDIFVIGDSGRLVVRSFLNSLKAVGVQVKVLAPDESFMQTLPLAKVHVILCLDGNIGIDVMNLLVDRVWKYGMHLYVIGKLEDFGVELRSKIRQLPMTVFSSWPVSMEQLQRAIARNRQERKRILVVSDKPDKLGKLNALLNDTYDVALAEGCFEAIDYLRVHEADLMLLDWELGGVGSYDTLDHIRHDMRIGRQPVILFDGKADRQSVLSVLELHSNGYILKGTLPDDFKQNVNNYFARL